MIAREHPTPTAQHDCGLCDGPLVWDGQDAMFGNLWHCARCGWTHVSHDCCERAS